MKLKTKNSTLSEQSKIPFRTHSK